MLAVNFPRPSPGGRPLLFARQAFGGFPCGELTLQGENGILLKLRTSRAARWARESGFQELVIFVVQGNRRAEQLDRGMGAKELYFFHDPVDGAPSWALAWEDLEALEELEMSNLPAGEEIG